MRPATKGEAEGVAVEPLDGSDSPQDLGAYEAKASAAWNVLSSRYGSQLSQVAIDHLYARFIMGLTLAGFGEGPPTLHLEACRHLLALNLPPERVEAALCDVPPLAETWVESAFTSIEDHGERVGREIAEGRGESGAVDAAAGR